LSVVDSAHADCPLVVDLDGTLLRSDMLVESAFAFFKGNPQRLLAPVFWLKDGKANLKSKLAEAAPIDVTILPYDPRVLSFLEQERARGRRLILATASHQNYADDIASHLGLFDRVLATHDDINLSAQTKRDVLLREFGENGFDYVGNSHDDLHVWPAARNAWVANPERGVEAAAQKLGNLQKVIHTSDDPLRSWIKQLRLHQWSKNLLIFVPLLAAHGTGDIALLLTGLLAFALFGLCASSVYLLNDLFDLEDDRRHPSKRFRPLACGAVPIKSALLLLPILLLGAFAGATLFLPWKFALMLLAYYLLTLVYTLVLKRLMTVDVIVLAMLYTSRIIAGAFAFGLAPTFWMLAFSMFLFLSLAFIKRYAELHEVRASGTDDVAWGRGYRSSDLEIISSLGASSGYLAVLVLAFYIQEQSTLALYRHPQVIWLACPILLYWVTRIWMIAHRGKMHDDPVAFALKDRASIVVVVLFALVFWAAT
jgi:4-hydroxybenzoate polyprenyltransferase